MTKLNDYLAPTDAAQLIGCTPGRVYQMLRNGDFSDVVRFGKRCLIGRKEAQKVANTPATTGRPRKNLTS